AGHLDTVAPNGNERARVEGDMLSGLGSADMKGGLAVMLELARLVSLALEGDGAFGRAVLPTDLTFVFYVCEEVDQRHSGLPQIESSAPDWLAGDAAILGEPTASLVEAGCQGVLRIRVTMRGARAHTARPWMGVNAVHRVGEVLSNIAGYPARRPVIDGCEYREAMQAVSVGGGVAPNVVPDEAWVVINHRFAPDRTIAQAYEAVKGYFAPMLDESRGDSIALEDSAAPAAPGLDHPLLSSLVRASGSDPRAKLGWTDVSFFASRGVPAANFGPGEPTLAHSAGERVSRDDLERALLTLSGLVGLR
ncbi:MAG: succinyl-diaminopimelate desuccinylase, partial [Acidimicrobiales bacterium]